MPSTEHGKANLDHPRLLEKLVQYFCTRHFKLYSLKQLDTQLPGGHAFRWLQIQQTAN